MKTTDTEVVNIEEAYDHPEGLHLFADETLAKLPDLYRNLVLNKTYATDRTALLFDLLIIGSGVLPNVYYSVDGEKNHYLPLMGYHIAPAATGKGNANIVEKLVDPIQDSYVLTGNEKLRRYKADMAAWKALRPKDKAQKPEPELESIPMLTMPANTTKPMLFKNLLESDGRGMMICTEADTSAQANKGEHGGFSDIFRNAAEHETISYGTKQDSNRVVKSPKMAILITSTPDQIAGIVKSANDGLVSRFMFLYWPNAVGNKVNNMSKSIRSRKDYNAAKTVATSSIQNTYEMLKAGNEIEWLFTDDQNKRAFEMVERYCLDIEIVSPDMHTGSDKRAPTILRRIAVQLDVLFHLQAGMELKSKTECSDRAFNLAMELMGTLWLNTLEVIQVVRAGSIEKKGAHASEDTLKKFRQAYINTPAITGMQASKLILKSDNPSDVRKASRILDKVQKEFKAAIPVATKPVAVVERPYSSVSDRRKADKAKQL